MSLFVRNWMVWGYDNTNDFWSESKAVGATGSFAKYMYSYSVSTLSNCLFCSFYLYLLICSLFR